MGEEAEAAGGEQADPAGVVLALTGASQSEADAYLRDQRHHLHEQLKQLRLDIWEKRFGLMLRAATVAVGLGIICFLAAAVWNAAHSDGLVIESFSVPPDLAERGLTGQVIAGELLDRLTELNQATISSRTGKSYAANWGDDIKVEIPDTGVSVAEVYRFLRRWLGHESHISGAVWRNQSGIVITARTDGKSVTVAGPDADIDGQIQKAAEAVFGLAEPYRYGAYLANHGRYTEANAVFRQQIASGSAVDRAWGLVGLARSLNLSGDAGARDVARLYREAVQLDPSNIPAVDNLGGAERGLSHLEAAASGIRKFAELLGRGEDGEGANSRPVLREMAANQTRLLMGAYGDYDSSVANIIRSGTGGSFIGLSTSLARAEFEAHDLKAARATSLDQDRQFQSADLAAFSKIRLEVELAEAEQNWPAAVAAAASAEPLLKLHAGLRERDLIIIAPLQAYAEARLGRFSAAESLIAATPGDCDECMLWRARIAELEGQYARADWWFVRAVHDAPSIPLMYAAWGQALLERGQPDAAIAQFKLANQKGPHFADPLEGWGEALMAKNQSHLAVAKFAAAGKFAPNWGRLHLKWGEALYYAGKKDEAQKQFAQAAQLDLSAVDKAELARVNMHV